MQSRRAMAVGVIATGASLCVGGCTTSPNDRSELPEGSEVPDGSDLPDGPLVGGLYGQPFTLVDGTAKHHGEQLDVVLANKEIDCVSVDPVPTTMVVDLAVPAEAFDGTPVALGAVDGLPRVALTSFEDHDGTFSQVSVVVDEGGYLQVRGLTGEGFEASIDVVAADLQLQGVFSARVCAP